MKKMDHFVDIHAHILPGVDDGSGSMEETIRMLHIALEQNITTIIATPHFAAGEKNASVEKLQEVRDKVQAEAEKLDKDFKILLGNELFYSEAVIKSLKAKDALTLAGSRYVLVEFSVRESYESIYLGMGELLRAGYIPILAHLERYRSLNKREDLLEELIKQGGYLQMNSSSLIGRIFDSEAAYNRKLFGRGFVHFIGSDCHDGKFRIPSIKTAAGLLQKKCDEKLMDKIFMKNPLNILENTYI